MSPSSSPSPSRSNDQPSLAQLAELVHRGAADGSGALLLSVDVHDGQVALGTWPIPPDLDHPADALVGFLAPPSWDAIGLSTPGLRYQLAPDGRGGAVPAGHRGGAPVRATVLCHRDGRSSSVLDHPGHPPQVLHDLPLGWVADALARSLGRPTPPPDEPLGHWVEAAWLDRIASIALPRPGAVRSWDRLARLHPLAPLGAAMPGALLALETLALEHESSWSRVRQLWTSAPLPTTATPPGGAPIRLADWFDDGTFCRWAQRRQPPADALLPAVLDALPTALHADLLDGLTTVGAHRS